MEAISSAPENADTQVRRAVRNGTGSQAVGQDLGLIAGAVVEFFGPKKVTQTIQLATKVLPATKLVVVSKNFEALGVEGVVAAKTGTSHLAGLDLATGNGVKLTVKARPLDSQYYSNSFQVKLDENIHFPGKSDRLHFQEANKQLYTSLSNDVELKDCFEKMHPGIYNSISPSKNGIFPSKPPTAQGLTWHHSAHENGVLELIPREHHRAAGAVQTNLHPNQEGGMKIWGGGRNKEIKK